MESQNILWTDQQNLVFFSLNALFNNKHKLSEFTNIMKSILLLEERKEDSLIWNYYM